MAGNGRRLVVGFGHRISSCGWAATADIVNYEVKRRAGQYESTYVDRAGRLREAIVVGSHDDAVALRDRLNAAAASHVSEIVRSLGLSRPKVEALRAVLDAAYHAPEVSRAALSAEAWKIVDAEDSSLAERRPILAEPPGAVPRWDVPSDFPFAAVVFDLDQTLVDSAELKTPDQRSAWAKTGDPSAVRALDVRGSVRAHDLPRLLAERGVKVALVTRSPENYADHVRSLFGIYVDVRRAGAGEKAAKVRSAAKYLGVDPRDVVIVGDDVSDVVAARAVGAVSLGPLWTPVPWDPRAQPDIACRDPELLLRVSDWRRLGYLAELALDQDPWLHSASWIEYGASKTRVLGRYFVAESPRHSDPLTQTILASKKRKDADAVVARALRLWGNRVRTDARVGIVTSIPPAASKVDRFAAYREITAAAFGGKSGEVVVNARQVGSLKGMSHARRRAVSDGRFAADPAVDGKHVLVLDDVTTSGATFAAAEAALLAAGAARVSCLAFAATQD